MKIDVWNVWNWNYVLTKFWRQDDKFTFLIIRLDYIKGFVKKERHTQGKAQRI
jgi:hypothetical protein